MPAYCCSMPRAAQKPKASTTGRLQPSTRALERRKRTDQLPSGGFQKHRRGVPAERPASASARSASAMLDQSGRVGNRRGRARSRPRAFPALSPPGGGVGRARVAPNLVEQPPDLPRVPAQALAQQLRASEALTSSSAGGGCLFRLKTVAAPGNARMVGEKASVGNSAHRVKSSSTGGRQQALERTVGWRR